MSRILIVDDEPGILNVLSTLMKAEGHEAVPVLGGEKAQAQLSDGATFDLMITDIRMAPVNGLDLLRMARESQPTMQAIMVTAYGSVESAVEAMKVGAFDYVCKPFKVDELLITVERALQYGHVQRENIELKAQLGTKFELAEIVAESAAMRHVCEMIEQVAPTDTTVLILGESGTGKELVAKAIHAHSSRREGKLFPINCAALPEPLLESELFGHVKGAFTGASANKEGIFEAAHEGTIFLDEIGTMPLSLQGKLLRVLQEGEIRQVGSNKTVSIDVRVIAATNSDLEELIADGSFREDLYYRLSVIPIEIKPLRERVDDIVPLVQHFMRREAGDDAGLPEIAPDVIELLESYGWPGNIRELENAVKHALAFAKSGVVTREVLPARILTSSMHLPPVGQETSATGEFIGKPLKEYMRQMEQEYLRYVLKNCDGNKDEAARILGVSLATLYRKLPNS